MISTVTETLDYMKASQAAPEATPLTTHMAGVIAAGTPGANILGWPRHQHPTRYPAGPTDPQMALWNQAPSPWMLNMATFEWAKGKGQLWGGISPRFFPDLPRTGVFYGLKLPLWFDFTQ
jgi:hypothetical protein